MYILRSVSFYEHSYKTFFKWGELEMDISQFGYLFEILEDDEVIRIELINGNKIYCLPSDDYFVEPDIIQIIKPIKDKEQTIIIDLNAIALVCTMSRQTYDLKLQRGELYV